MYIAQLALAIEDLLRPFACKTEGFGKRSKEFDNLRNVVVVLAILGAGLRIEKVIAGNELENLNC